MNQNHHHIISRFSWKTFFDQKENVHELQSRLSSWSRFAMKKEITAIFDKACPKGEVWKIPLLELDLGVIGFNELESELAVKLRKNLNDKLTELIWENKNNRSGCIEIQHEQLSETALIGYFFVWGIMPWNYKSTGSKINDIVAAQLQRNNAEFISMLRHISGTNINVRRRIAWQVNETNIKDIIKGLEPSDSKYIIGFSDAIVNIQEKETVVQAGGTEFKKNLWFWILNYLLKDHGSAFNKKAFLKSSIMQMAQHYNTEYDELLALMAFVADKVGKVVRLSTDFLITIRELNRENEFEKQYNKGIRGKDEKSGMDTLRNYFSKGHAALPEADKNEFNALIGYISVYDKKGLQEIINNACKSGNGILTGVKDLTNRSLKYIIYTLNPAASATLLPCIDLLRKLFTRAGIPVSANALWEISISYLYKIQDNVFKPRSFFDYCLNKLKTDNNILGRYMLEELTRKGISPGVSSVKAFEIYKELVTFLVEEMHPASKTFYAGRVHDMIDAFSKQLTLPLSGNAMARRLQRQLMQQIQVNPGDTLYALISFRDKMQLKKLMPYILSNDNVELLIRHMPNEQFSFFYAIRQQITALKSGADTAAIAKYAEKNLGEIWLRLIILKPGITRVKQFETLLEEMYKRLPSFLQGHYRVFIKELLGANRLRSHGISVVDENKIIDAGDINSQSSVLDRFFKSFDSSFDSKSMAGRLLADNFLDKEFAQIRQANDVAGNRIIDYFFSGGRQLMKELVEKYVPIIIQQIKPDNPADLQNRLTDLFWKCVVDFRFHEGKKENILKSFNAAVLFNFDISPAFIKTALVGAPAQQFKEIKELPGSIKITAREVFKLIETCMEYGNNSISSQGKTLKLKDLLHWGWNENPSKLRKIFTSIRVTPVLTESMQHSVSFKKFHSWMPDHINDASSEFAKTICFLYDFAAEALPAEQTKQLQKQYWRHLLEIAGGYLPAATGGEKLVNECIDAVQQETGKDSTSILLLFEKHSNWLSASVKKVLQKRFKYLQPLPDRRIQTAKKLIPAKPGAWLSDLCLYLIKEMEVPVWFYENPTKPFADQLMNEIVQDHPFVFLPVLKKRILTGPQVAWLSASLQFKIMINAIGRMNYNARSWLQFLTEAYTSFGKITLAGLSPEQLQGMLFRKVLQAWIKNNWKEVLPENFGTVFLQHIVIEKGISTTKLLSDIEKNITALALPVRALFENIKKLAADRGVAEAAPTREKHVRMNHKPNWPKPAINDGVAVRNAGLVIISSYIMLLFERLGLLENNKFIDTAAQAKAVHYLQFAVTGLSHTDENLLVLNKLLCGLPLDTPVADGIEISADEKKLTEGLIHAIIGYWPSIGDTSIEGFRGNWLVRDGVLSELPDKWELTVEKRAYDVLLQKFPFSFSVIKLFSMHKPLHVNWAY